MKQLLKPGEYVIVENEKHGRMLIKKLRERGQQIYEDWDPLITSYPVAFANHTDFVGLQWARIAYWENLNYKLVDIQIYDEEGEVFIKSIEELEKFPVTSIMGGVVVKICPNRGTFRVTDWDKVKQPVKIQAIHEDFYWPIRIEDGELLNNYIIDHEKTLKHLHKISKDNQKLTEQEKEKFKLKRFLFTSSHETWHGEDFWEKYD